MYTFHTYKIGALDWKGGWFWEVTKDVGPVEFIVAQSGAPYRTEDDAVTGYKAFIEWAAAGSTTPPPAAA